MNSDHRDNLIDLDRRTSPSASGVLASATTTSTLYTDLTSSPGPACVATVGATKWCQITWSALLITDTAGTGAWMSVALSGSYTLGAADNWALNYTPGSPSVGASFGISLIFGNITPGSLTVTAKYRVQAAATGSFVNRNVAALPLGS